MVRLGTSGIAILAAIGLPAGRTRAADAAPDPAVTHADASALTPTSSW